METKCVCGRMLTSIEDTQDERTNGIRRAEFKCECGQHFALIYPGDPPIQVDLPQKPEKEE